MRGTDKRSGELFSYVDLEQRVRADYRWGDRKVVGTALAALSGDFAGLYSGMGGPDGAGDAAAGAAVAGLLLDAGAPADGAAELMLLLVVGWGG